MLSRILVSILLLVPAAGGGLAESYPVRPIRLVVGSAPGGGNDFIARIISPKASELLGKQLVIDNRGGAGGVVAADIVAKANPDGYTVLQIFSNFVTLPALQRNLPFDVLKDFAPIVNIASSPLMLVANPSVPAGTLKELIEFAKKKKGALNYAAPGHGSLPHLTGELFKILAGIQMEHVAYKGGGPATAAVVGNEVQLYFGTIASGLTHAKSGRLRALGVTSRKRSSAVPQLPTIAEQGLPGFEVVGWFGMFVPARTPPSIVGALNRTVNKLLELGEVKERFLSAGVEPEGGNALHFGNQVRADLEKWGMVAKKAGITPK